MYIPTTLATLGILILALVLLRIAWNHLPTWMHSTMFPCSVAFISLIVFSYVTKWTFISHRLYALLLWCGVAGYGLLLVRFSLESPRWLTSVIAIILFLPIFSSSIVLPLANLFIPSISTVATVPLGSSLFSVRSVIDRSPIAPSATDLKVYYRPRWLPMLQHERAGVRFFDTQCNGSASYAVLQPGHRTVLIACPPFPSDPPGTPPGGAIVPLR